MVWNGDTGNGSVTHRVGASGSLRESHHLCSHCLRYKAGMMTHERTPPGYNEVIGWIHKLLECLPIKHLGGVKMASKHLPDDGQVGQARLVLSWCGFIVIERVWLGC